MKTSSQFLCLNHALAVFIQRQSLHLTKTLSENFVCIHTGQDELSKEEIDSLCLNGHVYTETKTSNQTQLMMVVKSQSGHKKLLLILVTIMIVQAFSPLLSLMILVSGISIPTLATLRAEWKSLCLVAVDQVIHMVIHMVDETTWWTTVDYHVGVVLSWQQLHSVGGTRPPLLGLDY